MKIKIYPLIKLYITKKKLFNLIDHHNFLNSHKRELIQ